MPKIINILKKILAIFFVFTLHIIISNILPYPFNHMVFLPSKAGNIWLIAPLLFLLELFAPTAFGLNFIAYFFTLIFMSWLFINIFTSRSLPFLALYFATGLIVYRVCFYTVQYFINYFIIGVSGFNINNLALNVSLETVLTVSVMAIYHLIYMTLNKKFNPKYLTN